MLPLRSAAAKFRQRLSKLTRPKFGVYWHAASAVVVVAAAGDDDDDDDNYTVTPVIFLL